MTEHAQIEERLKECEKRFLQALQVCPLAVTLTSARDQRYIEVNETFERITGWNRNEIIGRTPFDINIWVDPSQRVDYVRRLLSEGPVRNSELRARLKNREVRIALGYGALIEINGETCVLSLIADITDSKGDEEAKRAEAALSSMGRKLIQAHDQERTRIARELHEYVDRLMLLSVDLDQLRQNPPQSVEVSEQLAEARKQIEDLVLVEPFALL
jgi:PAS domain S-box-containing protein